MEEENDDGFLHLPDHTIAMRKACQFCLDLFESLNLHSGNGGVLHHGVDKDTIRRMRELSNLHEERRDRACQQFWSPQNNDNSLPPIEIPKRHISIEELEHQTETQQKQPWSFRREFQNLNIPCLITGLDATHFQRLNEKWRRNKTPYDDDENEEEKEEEEAGKINRRWFLEHLGEDHQVPLRYYKEEDSTQCLDGEGRAVECKTRMVTMKDWIDILNKAANNNSPVFYLKDWHLQQELPSSPPLYSCPEIFRHDLLNSFLMRFTTGDYRFCYWGPAQSVTNRHSDVLHSFSWSYNVAGTKEWTFYSPFLTDTEEIDPMANASGKQDRVIFTVRQETGQTIFVPAKWQHTVVNLEETISINHNWITTSNLDLTWVCLKTEMIAISNELQSWGDVMQADAEVLENMLRGCVGLDVTSFFLMILVQLLELAQHLSPLRNEITNKELNIARKEEVMFDIFQLSQVLQDVVAADDELVQLRNRLGAILKSDSLAEKAERMAKTLLGW
eukprot:CAMPEP_0178734908 /NCGR_PEP_ID=MMETSP0744-20121128/1602_1 /TAXON_ID=913974 /ORGANISM="Nitzschia punctata, Strain CCMP561" /LENGTH=502 /DNA_ID=CAMNT_0020387235 /DNA_START=151 /DNA_END=1656 /DNA_ORIENTATION=-